jgi:hypothetical protein
VPDSIQEVFGRLTLNDSICDRVRVLLVRVTRSAVEPALRSNSTALLDDVRRLVRHGVQRRRFAAQCDVLAVRVRFRAESVGGRVDAVACVRSDASNVVTTEAALDLLEVWQRRAPTLNTALCDVARTGGRLTGPFVHPVQHRV